MAKRTRVPAALHAELTEYSSLLRALRTSDTLDLVSQLAQPPPPPVFQASSTDNVSLTDDDGGDEGEGEDEEVVNESPHTETASHDAFPDIASSPVSRGDDLTRQPTFDKRKGKQRDTWTRWPLLAGDVHVPEWGLLDEVKHVAEHVLAVTDPNEQVVNEKGVEVAVDQADELSGASAALVPSHKDGAALTELGLNALTADSAAFLTRILALLAAHVPAAEKSMQNRITPINWETVVDVACAHGVASPRYATLSITLRELT